MAFSAHFPQDRLPHGSRYRADYLGENYDGDREQRQRRASGGEAVPVPGAKIGEWATTAGIQTACGDDHASNNH